MNTDLLIMRIKSLCSDRGVTMTTAFTESGVGKNFKSNFPSVSKKNLNLLANYFNVSVEYLTGEETDEEYTRKVVGLVMEWLEDNGYDYSEEEYDTVVISKDGMSVRYAKGDFATVCKSIKTSSEIDAFNLAMFDWENRTFTDCSHRNVINESRNVINESPNATLTVNDTELSKQERELIKMYREFSLEEQLNLITYALKVKNGEVE